MTFTDIFTPIRRRTKRAYALLFDNPAYLFGRGTRTTIFPNGSREIWISNTDGTASFRITASDGPAGFSVTVNAAVGTMPLAAHVLMRKDYRTEMLQDVQEITAIAYYPDDYSQAFKKWYECDARGADGNKTVPLPSDIGLVPRERKD